VLRADYSTVAMRCQVFSVTPSKFDQVNASSCQGADYTVLQRRCQVLFASMRQIMENLGSL
jgi:hypothetical protein